MFWEIFMAVWAFASLVLAIALVFAYYMDPSEEKKKLFSNSKETIGTIRGFVLTVALSPLTLGIILAHFLLEKRMKYLKASA